MTSRAFRIHKCVQQRDLSTDRLKFAKLFGDRAGGGTQKRETCPKASVHRQPALPTDWELMGSLMQGDVHPPSTSFS